MVKKDECVDEIFYSGTREVDGRESLRGGVMRIGMSMPI